MVSEYIINRISNAKSGSNEQWQWQEIAKREFAAINNWTVARPFPPEKIGRRGSDDYCKSLTRNIFDYCLFFKSGSVNAAIVSQPYPSSGRIDDAKSLAARLGLALYMPPANPFASIYANGTLFLIFTSRNTVVRWLPEQEQIKSEIGLN
jgi:hypothetical protein